MRTEEDILDGKIMIVDDEPPNVILLERMLKQKGYRFIRGITDPLDVIENYKEFKPDLVLLDLNMPYMNGFEVMGKIQELERLGDLEDKWAAHLRKLSNDYNMTEISRLINLVGTKI